jgi:hypothetical protein
MALESYFFVLKYQLPIRDLTNIDRCECILFHNFIEYRYYFSI